MSNSGKYTSTKINILWSSNQGLKKQHILSKKYYLMKLFLAVYLNNEIYNYVSICIYKFYNDAQEKEILLHIFVLLCIHFKM